MNDVAQHSTHWIPEQALVVYIKGGDVSSEACFTAMTGDCCDEQTTMDHSMTSVALTLRNLMNFKQLYYNNEFDYIFHHSCFVSVYHQTISTIGMLAVFVFYYRTYTY